MHSASEPLPAPGTVHVWDIRLDSVGVRVLPEDEARRAERFRAEPARERFAAARSALRDILARYTGVPAAELGFEYGANGKPALAGGWPVRFNLSHSDFRAVVAVAAGREVGVDIERTGRELDHRAIASRFFPRDEAEQAATPREFFRLWTRREAYLKALGCGFAGLGEAMRPGWTVMDLDCGEGWAAAVAAQGGPFEIVRRTYS